MRILTAALLPALLCGSWCRTATAERPNIVIVLADDLGYSDPGCYGGEINTPHLDQLAANGLRYAQFYNTARCWPTRAALLTGYYAQQVNRDRLPGAGGGGGNRNRRPDWALLLPEYLRTAGYRSWHSGKWHIDGTPIQGGFDRAYNLLDMGRLFRPRRHTLDDQPLEPVRDDDDYYATTNMTSRALSFLEDHEQSSSDRPFFLYLAFTVPHFPLQAPAADIRRYDGRYDAGWQTVRRERWQRLQQSGLVDGQLSAPERDLGPPYHFPDHLRQLGPDEVNRPLPWEELSPSQQEFQADKMEIHAAMVDRMDQEIGRVVTQLRSMDALDNTLFLFLSDNGASAEIMVRDDGHDPDAPRGSADTHLCLGPGWSTCSNTPFRRHKTWVHEGGIATPLIVHWPDGIAARGEIRHDVTHVIDVLPTILEVAEVTAAAPPDAPPRPGRSLVPSFTQDRSVQHEALWWLHEGHRAIRMGDWKLVAASDEPWELYNLATDRSEEDNRAAEEPERVARLAAAWDAITAEFVRLRDN